MVFKVLNDYITLLIITTAAEMKVKRLNGMWEWRPT